MKDYNFPFYDTKIIIGLFIDLFFTSGKTQLREWQKLHSLVKSLYQLIWAALTYHRLGGLSNKYLRPGRL